MNMMNNLFKIFKNDFSYGYISNYSVSFCNQCGWWSASKKFTIKSSLGAGLATVVPKQTHHTHAVIGSLYNLDITNMSLPMEIISKYLLADYSKMFDIHPGTYEELVCDIFSNYGYKSLITSYSKDGGIDIVLNKKEKL